MLEIVPGRLHFGGVGFLFPLRHLQAELVDRLVQGVLHPGQIAWEFRLGVLGSLRLALEDPADFVLEEVLGGLGHTVPRVEYSLRHAADVVGVVGPVEIPEDVREDFLAHVVALVQTPLLHQLGEDPGQVRALGAVEIVKVDPADEVVPGARVFVGTEDQDLRGLVVLVVVVVEPPLRCLPVLDQDVGGGHEGGFDQTHLVSG